MSLFSREQKYTLPKGFKVTEIGYEDSRQGRVYRIDEDKIIKIPRGRENWGVILNELNMNRELFEEGVSVPEPVGIRRVDLRSVGLGFEAGFVREYIEGEDLLKLKSRDEVEYDLAMGTMREEVQFAQGLGFITIDAGTPVNGIWTPRREVKLIDFCGWGRKNG